MESTVVIKVKYRKTLRRFNASIVDGKLDFDMEGLRVKVLRLFNFAPDANLSFTYVDEDGDVVTLADKEDLHDVVRQSLNPLRITVKLNTEKTGKMNDSGSSTPTRSQEMQSMSETLKTVTGTLREVASKLRNFSLNPNASQQVMNELVAYINRVVELQAVPESSTERGGASGSNPDLSVNKDTEGSNVKVGPSAKANSGVQNLKVNPVLPKADSPALKSSQLGTGRRVEVSAMQPPLGSMDLNVKLPDDHFSGMPDVSSDVKVPVGVKNEETKDSSGSHVGLNRVSECPFAGTVVGNDSGYPLPHLYAPPPYMGSYNPSGGPGSILHRGVQCDGCGALPITGMRFKSIVKNDFDLCSICFAKQGNERDYIRIPWPLTVRKSLPVKGMYDPIQHSKVRRHMVLPHVFSGPGRKGGRPKLDSCFIQDVNILDGTIMEPSIPFTKIWRMKNNGTTVWPHGTHLVWIGGNRLSNTVSVELEIPANGLLVEEELNVAIDFCAPELPGRYISYWRMASPSGRMFGQRVWVLIQVDAFLRDPPILQDPRLQNTCGFNLNLPPTNGSTNGPQIVNVDPMVKNSPENPNRGTELVEPILDASPNKDQELNFPINDTLLVGGGASNPNPEESSSSSSAAAVSYPVVDISEVEPIAHDTAPSPSATKVPVPTAPAQWEGGENEVEQKLLRELDEMGFKEADLNKEILRRNKYNLQQSVDDLCGVEEWDPILFELKEMGFSNNEANKKLLKKNNGSIKRVVMDLINGE